MCTLLTISADLWTGPNADAMRNRIKEDAKLNSDGFSLILCGDTNEDALSVQVMNVEAVLTLLDTIPWNRMWLHSRLSTTKVTGVEGCHGFRSYKGFLVQHNGIISAGGAKDLPVDSMIIPELLKYMELGDVVAWLHAYANYANVFFVNPGTGVWYVSRSVQGTLFTDGLGNYSSHPIAEAAISVAVGQNYYSEYKEPVKDVTYTWVPTSWNDYRYDWLHDDTDRDYCSSRGTRYYNSAWEAVPNEDDELDPDVVDAVDEALRDAKESLLVESSSDKTMRSLKMQATMEGWKTIPYDVYKRISKSERKELREFLKKIAS